MTVGIRNPPEAGEAAERGQRTPTPPRNRSKRSAAPVFLSEPPNYFGLLRECCSFLDSQAWGRHRKKNRDREDGCSCRMTLFCRKSEMGDIYDSNSRPAGKMTELGLWDSSGLSPPRQNAVLRRTGCVWWRGPALTSCVSCWAGVHASETPAVGIRLMCVKNSTERQTLLNMNIKLNKISKPEFAIARAEYLHQVWSFRGDSLQVSNVPNS